MMCSYKMRINLTKQQVKKTKMIMNICKFVYNYMLELKEYMYKVHKISMSRYDLQAILPVLKEIYPCLTQAHSQVIQFVIVNLIQAYDNFFNKKANHPKYKFRCNSFVYTQMDSKRNFKGNDIIYLPRLGNITCKFYRPINIEKVKTATIKVEGDDKWYIILVAEEKEMVQKNIADIVKEKEVGIDLGISNYMTMSDGTVYKNPKILNKSERKIKKLSKRLSKKKKGSRNRHKAKNKLNKAHKKIKNQRNDYMQKVTNELVLKYDVIIVEDLKIKSMQKSGIKTLNKNLANVSLYQTIQTLEYKCLKHGKIFLKVDPKNTSKKCSKCGRLVNKKLTDRVHICECGLILDRDLNASINILNKGLDKLKAS